MKKAAALFALLVGLTACQVHGGFGVGENSQQPTHVASNGATG
jgi:hypothetical protein